MIYRDGKPRLSKEQLQQKQAEKVLEDRKRSEAFKARMDIDPAIFNKQEARTEDLHLNLSEKYMIYKDYAERCMLNPQHIGKKPKSVTVLNIRQGGQ